MRGAGGGAASPFLSSNPDAAPGGRVAVLRKKDRLRGKFEPQVTETVLKKCCELVTKHACWIAVPLSLSDAVIGSHLLGLQCYIGFCNFETFQAGDAQDGTRRQRVRR